MSTWYRGIKKHRYVDGTDIVKTTAVSPYYNGTTQHYLL